MPESIIGALIAIGGVCVGGLFQFLIEIWKTRLKRRQEHIDEEKKWFEEIYYARTIKAILNINISDELRSKWDNKNNKLKTELLDKLSKLNWHAARLRRANLKGMLLNKLFMPAADLTEANLDGITLSNSFMPEAIFVKASFRSISKSMLDGNQENWGASLFHSFFYRADFSETCLPGADLTYTNFLFAELWAADLSGSDLSFAKLNFANLSEAVLRNTILSQTDFTGAYVGKCDFRGAKIDELTIKTLKKARGIITAIFDEKFYSEFN